MLVFSHVENVSYFESVGLNISRGGFHFLLKNERIHIEFHFVNQYNKKLISYNFLGKEFKIPKNTTQYFSHNYYGSKRK